MEKQAKEMTKIEKDELKQVVKAVYKSVLKTLRDKAKKQSASKVIEDILDQNYVAQVDPDKIPNNKDKVLYKKDDKSPKSHEKGVKKLKRMCKKVKNKKSCKNEPIPGLNQK